MFVYYGVFNVPQSSLNTSYTIMGCTVPHTHQTGWPNGLSHLTQVILHKYTSYIYITHLGDGMFSTPHSPNRMAQWFITSNPGDLTYI